MAVVHENEPRWPGEKHRDYWGRVGNVTDFVYFIQGDPDTPVKIGFTRDIERRLHTLQTGNPQELHLLVLLPGTQRVEVAYHRLLSDCRIRGEWFQGGLVDEALDDARDGSITMALNWDRHLRVPDPFKCLAMVNPPERYDPRGHTTGVELGMVSSREFNDPRPAEPVAGDERWGNRTPDWLADAR